MTDRKLLKALLKDCGIFEKRGTLKKQKILCSIIPKEVFEMIEAETSYLKCCQISERLYHIFNDLTENVKCQLCENNAVFHRFGKGYRKFCKEHKGNRINSKYKVLPFIYDENHIIDDIEVLKTHLFKNINISTDKISPAFVNYSKYTKNIIFLNSIIYFTKNIIPYSNEEPNFIDRIRLIQLDVICLEKCPICHKEVKFNYYKYKNKYFSCGSCKRRGIKQSKELIEKRIKPLRGKKRPEFRKKMKEIWETKEYKLKHSSSMKKYRESDLALENYNKQSFLMKEKIALGEFTPCITNSWANSRVRLKETKNNLYSFRSTWEALFWSINQDLTYEKIRIKYEYNDNWHNYITDFQDYENKIIYEVKPKCYVSDEKIKAKEKAAIAWCEENNWEYKFITEDWFKENIEEICDNLNNCDYFLNEDIEKMNKSVDNFK